MREVKTVTSNDTDRLAGVARQARRDVLSMIQNAGSGNPGSALSSVEILVWLLHHEMCIKPDDPKWPKRDRLILSKGHSVPVFYSLVTEFGWVGRDELLGFRQFNTRLQTHPDYNVLDCIDYTTGSLGQGLSAAIGMALAGRYLRQEDPRFFVLIGDGEIQEGQVWEAAMTAGSYALDSVVLILDRNGFQQDGAIADIIDIEPLADKWRAFNWQVAEADGHTYNELSAALATLTETKPKVIIAHTIKGKGVSFMEGNNAWHTGGKKFTTDILEQALAEIEA